MLSLLLPSSRSSSLSSISANQNFHDARSSPPGSSTNSSASSSRVSLNENGDGEFVVYDHICCSLTENNAVLDDTITAGRVLPPLPPPSPKATNGSRQSQEEYVLCLGILGKPF